MTTSNLRKQAVAIDNGTVNMAINVFENGKSTPIISPVDGAEIPTVLYTGKKNAQWHVGKAAVTQSYDDPGDNLFMHAKRHFFESPDKPIYAGKYTPKDVVTELLRHARQLLLTAKPDLADYLQFSEDKLPAEELGLAFTVPANWTLEQYAHYEEAITAAGFQRIDGFVPEPIAAARRVAHMSNIHLRDGQTVLVMDMGGGTFDLALLEYRQSVYHQLRAAGGDAYLAGTDFTMKIAELIAQTFRVSWKNVSNRGALDLSGISSRNRPFVLACYFAAEDAKKQLSVIQGEVAVPVEFPKGRKTFRITRQKATELWQPLLEKVKAVIQDALAGTNLTFDDIDYPMLVGGSAPLPGLREAVAEAMGRDVSDVLICTDSAHVVAAGAAEHAYYQDDASQALESGLGLIVISQDTDTFRNLLLVPPGKVIPPEGLFLEHRGFQIQTSNNVKHLACRPFVCKTGVRASVVQGRSTFLADTEILRLEPVATALHDFPDGDHPLVVGIKIDPNRNLRLLVRPTSLPNVEPLSIPLALEKQSSGEPPQSGLSIFLVLDRSGSMRGAKIEMLKRATASFVTQALARSCEVGIIVFPFTEVLVELSRDISTLIGAVGALNANAGTPMGEALDLTVDVLAKRATQKDHVVVLFTDGEATDPERAIDAAAEIRKVARLITVGVGDETLQPFLIRLASSPTDYFPVANADGILRAFECVAELIWTDVRPPSIAADTSSPPATPAQDPPQDDYDQDWDEIGKEAAAQ